MKKSIYLYVIVSICLLTLLGVGISYSMWNMTVTQDTENIISTVECFDLSISNQKDNINLENTYPISDTKGKTLTPFTFTITNTCTTTVNYSINLEVLKNSTLSSNYVKAMVNSNDPKFLSSYDNSSSMINTDSIESRLLDNGLLYKDDSITYQVRLWIDENTTLEDLNNETKTLKSKIVIIGEPSNEEKPISLADKVTELSNTDTANFAKDDPDSNIRYIGADPSNYVYFNCRDYSNQSDSTCEKWRIIGLFNNVTKSDGSKENLIKIIRDESIGGYSWDSSDSSVNSGSGVNDWSDADLMKLLNSGYDSETVGGSLYWNAKSGTCYNGSSNSTTSCDFTSTGLKNDTTRNAIESVVWNLGGTASFTSSSNGLVSHFYGYERGTTVYTGHATTWTGKIGLMYPSDYGYATSGGSTTDRATCLAKELYSLDSSDVSDCKNNDYLYKSGINQWTLTPSSGRINGVFYVLSPGCVNSLSVYNDRGVRPALYLKSDISIDTQEGDGSSSNPYRLMM